MSGNLKHEYDHDETGEVFKLDIEYDYVPYHPADRHGPAEGGGCDEIICEVIGYRQYDDDGQLIIDWPVLADEHQKKLTKKFDKLVENSLQMQEYFQKLCDRDAEKSMERDYD